MRFRIDWVSLSTFQHSKRIKSMFHKFIQCDLVHVRLLSNLYTNSSLAICIQLCLLEERSFDIFLRLISTELLCEVSFAWRTAGHDGVSHLRLANPPTPEQCMTICLECEDERTKLNKIRKKTENIRKDENGAGYLLTLHHSNSLFIEKRFMIRFEISLHFLPNIFRNVIFFL